MTFMKWAATAAVVAATALVSGCGGGGSDSGNADIRLINASVGYPSLDMSVNGNVVGTSVAYGTASNYSNQNVNATTATIASGGITVLAPSLSSVICGARCSFIAYGWNGGISRVILQENLAQPSAGYTALNLQNLAPDAGALDIYLTALPTDPLSSPIASGVAGGNGSGFVPVDVTKNATFTITLTGYNNKNDVRLKIPNVSLPALQVATLIATATPGGTLVNGILAVQNGAVTPYTGTNARVRMVATVTGNPTVSATRAGITVLDAQVATAVGDYVTVPASADPVNACVNATCTNVTGTFVAGHDYTVLAYGSGAAPQYSVLDDNNQLPLVAGTTKLRVVNGLANTTAGVTMTLDFVKQASGVVPGTASTPSTVTVTNTTNSLVVTSPLAPGVNLFKQDLTLLQGGLYEVILFGDTADTTTAHGQLNKLR
ncbi:DUF4397 domain-containing protein [Pelomonas sp. KK5]|uniref:DUF4397 domain-containing protein n=1 Tax=Pelomonas sp. KK5 TaxID=1855730 RepID=UPI0009FA5F5F|nr:DUF4397 domain-containing protein [Pelomonas sp. KK5]